MSIPYKTLKQTNYCYDGERIADYEALMEGGNKYESRIRRYVTRGLLDVDSVYAQKCEVAKQCLNNYFTQIINYYAGFIFNDTFEVYNTESTATLPIYYKSLQDNCDGSGTNLHDFMRDVMTSALCGKRSLITLELCDLPDKELTRKQFDDLSLGDVELTKYSSSEVLDWCKDGDNNLLWVKTCRVSTHRASWHLPESIVETYKIYTSTSIITYVVTYNAQDYTSIPHDLKEYEVTSVTQHNLGQCPAILIDLNDNHWLGDKIAPAQKRNINDEITAKWAINKGVYAMPVMFCENRENAESVYSLNRTGIVLGEKDKVSMLEPNPEHARIAREACRASKDEIFRVAHLKQLSQENNSYWRTGSAVALDSSSAHTAIRVYGSIVKETILKIFNLLARARVEELSFNVIGFESFDLLDSETLMKLSVDSCKIMMPPTARKLLSVQTSLAILKDLTPEEKQLIRSEAPEMISVQPPQQRLINVQETPDDSEASSDATEDDFSNDKTILTLNKDSINE